MRALLALGLVAVALSGCGDQTDPPVSGAGDVPITQRAIAAMALLHLPDDTTTREATYTDRSYPEGALGADLRYGGGAETDGDLLQVFLVPGHGPQDPCADYPRDRCEAREVGGGTLSLGWETEEPEEDPGYVWVELQRADERVSVSWYGDVIKGDPREQDLEISIDDMEAVAQDPRISLTTSQAVVDAGEDLDDWGGGEPDPHAYDQVPATGDALINAYWMTTGGYGAYHDRGPSPLVEEFGPGAVGGRFTREREGREHPAMTIDVVASPQRPEWMPRDPCAAARFRGHCTGTNGSRGWIYLAWVPGPAGTGEMWAVQPRADDVVTIRYSDRQVPASKGRVTALADWYDLKWVVNNRRLGLMTDKEVVDATF